MSLLCIQIVVVELVVLKLRMIDVTGYPKQFSSVIPGKFFDNTTVGQKIGIHKVKEVPPSVPPSSKGWEIMAYRNSDSKTFRQRVLFHSSGTTGKKHKLFGCRKSLYGDYTCFVILPTHNSLVHQNKEASLFIDPRFRPLCLNSPCQFTPVLTLRSHVFGWLRTFFLAAFAKSRKATIGFVMSVCPSAWNNSVPTGRVFMKFDIWAFSKNLPRKFKFH